MKAVPCRLLVLSLVVFWTTGLGQFLHERFEHAPSLELTDGRAVNVKAATSQTFRVEQQGHSHDDCPVCSMLSHMAAGRCATDVLIVLPNERVATLTLQDRLAPLISFEQFLPSRGPPLSA